MLQKLSKWLGGIIVGAIGAVLAASLGLQLVQDSGLTWIFNFGNSAVTETFDTSAKVKEFRASAAIIGYGETVAWAAQPQKDGNLITSCDDSRFDRVPIKGFFFTSLSRNINHQPNINSVLGFCGYGVALFYYKRVDSDS